MEEIQALEGGKNLPAQTIKNGKFYYTVKGNLVQILEATHLDQYVGEEERVEVDNGFTMTLFNSKNEVDAVITALRGTYLVNEGILVAKEDVVVAGADNTTLYSEEIIWYQDSAKIVSPDSVRIVSEDGVFRGAGLISDDTFTNYELREVSGDIFIPERALDEEDPK